MMFSSFLYFHPVLKATPTPTHSRLMQKMSCEGYTHIKMFSLKRSLYYISMWWFPCPGTFCRASRRAWEKCVKKHSHSCCHHHGSLMSPTSLCVHQWRIYFLLVSYLETGSGWTMYLPTYSHLKVIRPLQKVKCSI